MNNETQVRLLTESIIILQLLTPLSKLLTHLKCYRIIRFACFHILAQQK